MYCPECGEEIEEDVKFCPECGHSIDADGRLDSGTGEDYDIAMSVYDGLNRRSSTRMIVDIIALVATAGVYGVYLAIELLKHHRNIRNGDTEPWDEGDSKEFFIISLD
jgi:uncharacterized membrane protein YvbJ